MTVLWWEFGFFFFCCFLLVSVLGIGLGNGFSTCLGSWEADWIGFGPGRRVCRRVIVNTVSDMIDYVLSIMVQGDEHFPFFFFLFLLEDYYIL